MLIGGNNKILQKKKAAGPHKKSKLLLKYPDSLFVTEPSSVQVHTYGVISNYPGTEIDYDKTIDWVWWEYEDSNSNRKDGLTITSHGVFNTPFNGTTSVLGVGSYGVFPLSKIFPNGTSSVKMGSYANIFTKATRKNFVSWSKIGSLDFTIGKDNKDNIAGTRPLDWAGWVYSVKKLGDKAVAYGENGVSFLVPVGKTFGLNTIYRTGLKGRTAVAGNDSVHFFIDVEGRLFQVSEGIDLLDYSEYLSSLNSNVVLTYDPENVMLYICDGSLGYIYSAKDKSLGTCAPNITGMGKQGGTMHTVASGTIVTPPFVLCTDIYDMGTTKYKTIFQIEFGTNLSGTLQAAIDYRANFKGSFTQTSWKAVPSSGAVLLTALGREFRIRAKLATYEYFEPDYIKVNGLVHAH